MYRSRPWIVLPTRLMGDRASSVVLWLRYRDSSALDSYLEPMNERAGNARGSRREAAIPGFATTKELVGELADSGAATSIACGPSGNRPLHLCDSLPPEETTIAVEATPLLGSHLAWAFEHAFLDYQTAPYDAWDIALLNTLLARGPADTLQALMRLAQVEPAYLMAVLGRTGAELETIEDAVQYFHELRPDGLSARVLTALLSHSDRSVRQLAVLSLGRGSTGTSPSSGRGTP